jgi:hypothetical protein
MKKMDDTTKTHRCQILDAFDRTAVLMFQGTPNQRWAVKDILGECLLPMVHFCPGCGTDFRKECNWKGWDHNDAL